MKREMTTTRFMSEYAKERMERDLAIYSEFTELTAEPRTSKNEVAKYLMKKYGIHSYATIWAIRKKIEKLLRED